MPDTPFTLTLHQQVDLPLGAREVDAAVTITAADLGATARPPAVVLIIDCSASMRFPASRLLAAQEAAAAALQQLPDGVPFAVIRGTRRAGMIYPAQRRLVAAGQRSRQDAVAALGRIEADGGTAMGTWLLLARELLETHQDAPRHAILLTDGRDESESDVELESALEQCEGRFACDACGIGDAWDPTQLRRIASVLRGGADGIVEESALIAHFRELTRSATAKAVSDLRLRIRTMPFCRIGLIEQKYPQDYDLTDRLAQVEPGVHELATGTWSSGDRRSYRLRFILDPVPATQRGQERQIAVAQLEPASGIEPVPVLARSTDGPARPTAAGSLLEDFDRRSALAAAVEAGRAAHAAGSMQQAAREWGLAVRIAAELGDQAMLQRLGRIGTIVDAAAGRIDLAANVSRTAVLAALIGTTIAPVTPAAAPLGFPGLPVRCNRPACGGLSPAGALYCSVCGHELGR